MVRFDLENPSRARDPTFLFSLEPKTADTCPWEVTPYDLENEELAAYAEEYDALADFDDMDALGDDVFDIHDGEDGEETGRRTDELDHARSHEDVTMS
jgi:hypothetical protein